MWFPVEGLETAAAATEKSRCNPGFSGAIVS
jgi:hypothetical protein